MTTSMVQSADKLFEIPFDTSYHAKQAATVMLLCTPFLPVPPSYNFTVFKLNAPHLKHVFQSWLKYYGTRNNVEIRNFFVIRHNWKVTQHLMKS